MKLLAWFLVVSSIVNVISEPFLYGKPRENYGKTTWIGSIIGASIFIPICGRVLGWW